VAEAEAERFRKDPAAFPDSEIAQFYLDAEVLRDDRRRERLWHLLYAHLLDRDAYFDKSAIFRVVTEAFQPARDADGRLRARDASEIVALVRDTLRAEADRVYASALDTLGLDLARGLDLEQRYIHLLDQGEDLDALRSAGKLDEAMRSVPSGAVQRGIEDRLVRTYRECVVLAHIDQGRRDDPTVTPADVFYAGLHARFDSDEAGSLGQLLRGAVPGVNFVPDWGERDSLVLYRAMLGVPVYWFKNVGTVLEPAYRKVYADPRRSYPLHIEASWEREPGVPNLDPIEIKAAEERRLAEQAAKQAAADRSAKIRTFTLCTLFGQIQRQDGVFTWRMASSGGPLGPTRAEAFEAFQAMDPTLRGILEQQAEEVYTQRTSDRRKVPELQAELAAHLASLTAAYAAAVQTLDDREKHFVGDERLVIEAALASL
jgi:hypothetical protein